MSVISASVGKQKAQDTHVCDGDLVVGRVVLSDGLTDKGGRNRGASQVRERPAAPAPLRAGFANPADTPERIKAGYAPPRVTAREAGQRAIELIRAGTVPNTFVVTGNDKQTKARLVVAIRMGADLGMPPSTALDKIILQDGRYCILCAGALALAQRGGLVERVERKLLGVPDDVRDENTLAEFTDAVSADYRIWRRGQSEPYVGRYSIRDARRAGLWRNPKRPWWMNAPGEMLMVRATAIALRAGFMDNLGGLSILEEVRDLPPAAPTVTNTDFLMDATTEGAAEAIRNMPEGRNPDASAAAARDDGGK
jgi:hypothetical protein